MFSKTTYLTIFHFGVVEAVGQEDPPELGYAVGVRLVVVLVVGECAQQVPLNL